MNNYLDTKERWKLLSKELELKQEVIDRVLIKIDQKSHQLKDKGILLVRMREENNQLDKDIFKM